MTHISKFNLASFCAMIFAISVVFAKPVFETMLVSHILMALAVLAWAVKNFPTSITKIIWFVVGFTLYIGLISQIFGLGERVFVESAKIVILTLFVISAKDHIELSRRTLSNLAVVIAIFLIGYVLFSDDPFIYGGRLGLSIDESNDKAVISANTIGLAINLTIANIFGVERKKLYPLIPILIILLFLTYSRGSLFCFGLMAFSYLLRKNLTIYAIASLSIGFIVFFDSFSTLFYTLRLDDHTGSGRTVLYEMMYETMRSNPLSILLGFGPGAIYFEIYRGTIIISAHSGYMEMVYTFGLLGIAATSILIFRILSRLKQLSMDSLLYVVLIAGYAISEDMLGAHALFAFGLMFAVILKDISPEERHLRPKQGLSLPRARMQRSW